MSNNGTSVSHIKNTSTFAMIICVLSLILKTVSAIMGRTTLQYIDAVRCLIETSVVVVWWYICYRHDMKVSKASEARFNMSVRGAMLCSAVLMGTFAVIRYMKHDEESGSMLLGVLISVIGTVNNTIICLRYRKKAKDDKTVKKQSTMFGIKSFADASVALTLILSILFPGYSFTVYCRLATSLAVSVAMALGGILKA